MLELFRIIQQTAYIRTENEFIRNIKRGKREMTRMCLLNGCIKPIQRGYLKGAGDPARINYLGVQSKQHKDADDCVLVADSKD